MSKEEIFAKIQEAVSELDEESLSKLTEEAISTKIGREVKNNLRLITGELLINSKKRLLSLVLLHNNPT